MSVVKAVATWTALCAHHETEPRETKQGGRDLNVFALQGEESIVRKQHWRLRS